MHNNIYRLSKNTLKPPHNKYNNKIVDFDGQDIGEHLSFYGDCNRNSRMERKEWDCQRMEWHEKATRHASGL